MCLPSKLGRLVEAVATQERAICMYLSQQDSSLLGVPLVDLVGKPCVNLDSSIQLQSHLKNLAIYKLSVDPQDSVGLRLLLSGISSDQGYW